MCLLVKGNASTRRPRSVAAIVRTVRKWAVDVEMRTVRQPRSELTPIFCTGLGPKQHVWCGSSNASSSGGRPRKVMPRHLEHRGLSLIHI